MIGEHDPLWGTNTGLVALAANTAVVVVGSLLVPARRGELTRAEQARRAVAPEPMGA